VDVYLDAVFHPNCVRDEKTFAQEGWHYELEKPEVRRRSGAWLLRRAVFPAAMCSHVPPVCVRLNPDRASWPPAACQKEPDQAKATLEMPHSICIRSVPHVNMSRIEPQRPQRCRENHQVELLQDDIVYKGVVFNEMKGVYSQPDSMNGTLTQQALFPDNSYAVDSGGNPSIIPDLTFEEFRVRPACRSPQGTQIQ